jgi:hypothetical protein
MTYSIPEVATLLGIGRNAAYEAATRGDFPSLKFGNRIVVPKIAIERMLGIDPKVAAPHRADDGEAHPTH